MRNEDYMNYDKNFFFSIYMEIKSYSNRAIWRFYILKYAWHPHTFFIKKKKLNCTVLYNGLA